MDAPISRWLKETRERQIRPDGQPWSQDDLLSKMQAEVGWAPHRPNYSKYETGKATPKPDTLARFVEFWAKQGEPAPDLTPPRPAPVLDPYAVLDRHAAAMEAQAQAFSALAASIDRAADRVTGRVEDVASAFEDVVQSLRTLLPRDGDGSPDATARGR